jgi:hypothetical protein
MANPSIIGLLQSQLKKTLGDQTIRIGELEEGTGNYSIVSCLGIMNYMDEETSHLLGLFPFRVADTFNYWLSISLKFNYGNNLVSHISISFFDDTLYKMFRAEWANNVLIAHAQPHWHIHKKNPDFSSPLWDAEVVKNFPDDVNEAISDKLKNIHFAMASSWHNKSTHVLNLADSKKSEVLNWIDGVLNYVNQQLTYIHDKTKVS